MIQTLLLFLAPNQELPTIPRIGCKLGGQMATKAHAVPPRKWGQQAKTMLAISGNTLGLILFLGGLGLVLRLVEVVLS